MRSVIEIVGMIVLIAGLGSLIVFVTFGPVIALWVAPDWWRWVVSFAIGLIAVKLLTETP